MSTKSATAGTPAYMASPTLLDKELVSRALFVCLLLLHAREPCIYFQHCSHNGLQAPEMFEGRRVSEKVRRLLAEYSMMLSSAATPFACFKHFKHGTLLHVQCADNT